MMAYRRSTIQDSASGQFTYFEALFAIEQLNGGPREQRINES